MFSKIIKGLKKSILSATGVGLWATIARDLSEQAITGYKHSALLTPSESCPKFSENQLVRIRYHHHWQQLHKEIGIITDVCDTSHINGPVIYFYEVLVGEEKITIVEKYIDEVCKG
jgi:hypothetical protein